jgi:hypothetical protein
MALSSRLEPRKAICDQESSSSEELRKMSRSSSRCPSIVPGADDDRDIYLVLDDFGERLGRAWRETDEERTDRETVIRDLLTGQYSNPVRVVAFNTVERWSRDVSEEVADELGRRFSIADDEIPTFFEGFFDRHRRAASPAGAAVEKRRIDLAKSAQFPIFRSYV